VVVTGGPAGVGAAVGGGAVARSTRASQGRNERLASGRARRAAILPAAARAIVAAGYLSEQEIDRDIALLDRPDFMMPSSAMWTAWGQRP
jgi:hypothetical protein